MCHTLNIIFDILKTSSIEKSFLLTKLGEAWTAGNGSTSETQAVTHEECEVTKIVQARP